MTQRPKVSIGVPVYNGERYLAETLDSLITQTYQDIEIIISDNASTDSTPAICRDYAARDPRIRIITQPTNIGAAKNYNAVFAAARGEYFKWNAGDDLCAPDYVERCVAQLDADPEVVLAYAKAMIIDMEGNETGPWDDNLHLMEDVPTQRFWQLLKSLAECNAVFGLMRRDILAKTPLIGRFVGSDGALLAELALYGKFYEVPAHLFLRREHPQASSWATNKGLDAQMQFFDPKLRGKLVFPTFSHASAYLRAGFTAPLPVWRRGEIVWMTARYLGWNRRQIASELANAATTLWSRFTRRGGSAQLAG